MLNIRENGENDGALFVRNMIEEHRRTDTENMYNNERIKDLKKKSRCHNCRGLEHWWQDNVCSRLEKKQYKQRIPKESSNSATKLTESRDTMALVTQPILLTSISEAVFAQHNNQEV